jgi:hypothetical protein
MNSGIFVEALPLSYDQERAIGHVRKMARVPLEKLLKQVRVPTA